MSRLPRMTGKQVKSALLRKGFKLVHTRGSHFYFELPGEGRLVTVPIHTGRILAPKTLKSILRQAGMTGEELKALI